MAAPRSGSRARHFPPPPEGSPSASGALAELEPHRGSGEADVLTEAELQEAPVVVVEMGRGVHEYRELGRTLPGLRHVIETRRAAQLGARYLALALHLDQPLVEPGGGELLVAQLDPLPDQPRQL